ncbi:hypothetical protein BGZ60DRAFT_421926 [Tricladium varicosporioides]|nr:hypothetical protein BGZ60DRAFT_421630 [Hymenoscyphus varicosporioides]KAH8650404.1 hypothetical protein BGZ60DRAFT_421926 [Hymenoscyphus varicosporioides]
MDLNPHTNASQVRKRKAESDLSTNPNTVKARKRNEAISQDPVRMKVEKAKAADQGAITYARNILRKSENFKNASAERQKELLDESAAKTILKRERNGKDWKSVARASGYGEFGGVFAVEDDNNSAWEDIEFEKDNEFEFEQMWRKNEAINHDPTVEDIGSVTELEVRGTATKKNHIKNMSHIEFASWQAYWKLVKKTLFEKIKKANSQLSEAEMTAGPGKYFSASEKALWRNLVSWSIEDEWVDLPGPASWWPIQKSIGPEQLSESHKVFDQLGFKLYENKAGYFNAWKMVMEPFEPTDGSYNRILPSEEELVLLDDTIETRDKLRDFYTRPHWT